MAYLLTPKFLDEVIHGNRLVEHFSVEGYHQGLLDEVKRLYLQPEATRQIVTNDGFGTFVSDAVAQMQQSNVDLSRFALSATGRNTTDHMLALVIERKRGKNPDQFVLRGFDPNLTGNHKRLVIEAECSVEGLTVLRGDHFFPQIDTYLASQSGAEGTLVAMSLEGMELAPPGSLRYVGGDDAVAHGNVDFAQMVSAGLSINLPELLAHLPMTPVPPGVETPVWASGVQSREEPALHHAAHHDHGDALVGYAHFLKNSICPPQLRWNFFAASTRTASRLCSIPPSRINPAISYAVLPRRSPFLNWTIQA